MSWTLIESQTLGSSVASVTLGNGGTLPQTYKTLKLIVSARSDQAAGGGDMGIQLNSITTGYSARQLLGDGSSAFSQSTTSAYRLGGFLVGANATTSTFASTEIVIPNYAGSTNKAMSIETVGENNATQAYQGLQATLVSNSAAVTSITISLVGAGNLISGSTFTLYGLK